MIRRRHVFYLAGYDPLGLAHYNRLFKRETARSRKIWPVDINVTDAVMAADSKSGQWQIESSGPDWQVSTTYEYLRWDDLITRHMKRPMPIVLLRTLLCLLEYLFNGTVFRIFRSSWRFGLFYLSSILALLLLAAIPAAILVLSGKLLTQPWGWFVGAALALGAYTGGRKVAERWAVFQLCAAWIWFHDWMHGRTPECLVRYDEFAQRIVAKALAHDVDEIVIIGHSGGGTISLPVVARALELNPDFPRSAPPVTLLVLGSSLPMAALHPRGAHVREAIRRVAAEPGLVWIDVQARKDAMNFYNSDMVEGAGVDMRTAQHNPYYWRIRYRDSLAPELYNRLRWDLIRMHFQFIMANDRRAAFDYVMLVSGPAPVRDWPQSNALLRFAADASYAQP